MRIDTFAFDDDVILLAGNNAQGNFHIQRYKGKFNAYQRTYVITAKEGYDIDYIKYSLELSLQHLKHIAQGSQTKFLTMQILDSFQIVDISYDDQKRLVGSLREIDSKVLLNKKICAELEDMAKTLYDYWFTQFDFPNAEGKPYRTSGGEMAWNEQLKREIPKGWEVKSIIDCCEIVDCLHSEKPAMQYVSEQYYLLQLENLVGLGLVDLSEKYYVSKEMYKLWTSRIEVTAGDLVVTNAGRAGAVYRIPDSIRAGMGRNMTAIHPVTIPPALLYYFFISEDMKSQIRANTDQGAFFKSLNVRGIKQLKIALPKEADNNIISDFETKSSVIRQMIEDLIVESSELTKLRDWLLPMLMNGQATVE